MKKVMFIRKDNGCSSLEDKAEALKKVGHLESIQEDPLSGDIVKYYSMPALHDYGKCAEVIIRKGRVISVRNVPEDAMRYAAPVNIPKFGGF